MEFDFEREREQRKRKRVTDLCAALTARGVPNMTYDDNPGKVLVNFGQSAGGPFNGLVPCWIDPTDTVVTFDVGGSENLYVPEALRPRALEAMNRSNGEDWWSSTGINRFGRIVVRAGISLDDETLADGAFFVMRDLWMGLANRFASYMGRE